MRVTVDEERNSQGVMMLQNRDGPSLNAMKYLTRDLSSELNGGSGFVDLRGKN